MIPGDPRQNAEAVVHAIRTAAGANLIVLPELALTGCSCGSLFTHDALLDAAEDALAALLRETNDVPALIAVGLPVRVNQRVYNCAAVMSEGNLLGVVPKSALTSDSFFQTGAGSGGTVVLCGETVPFGTDLLFDGGGGFRAAFTLGEDPAPPPAATVVGHLSAVPVWAGERLRDIVRVQSARLRCAVVCASADACGPVCRVIAENGVILDASGFEEQSKTTVTELDLGLLAYERRHLSNDSETVSARAIPFRRGGAPAELKRRYSPEPFAAEGGDALTAHCRKMLAMQVRALQARLKRLPGTGAAVSVSGGLDSALALLVAERAASREERKLLAATMPGPGTTERTLKNAQALCKALGVPLKTVPIFNALEGHIKDIGHGGQPDVTYENAQARERAQIMMDMAGIEGCIVVGSSDLSETALGFTTFAGDQLSMFGVNAGVPKTLIRHIVRTAALDSGEELRTVLLDILDTPVSPELLPIESDGTQRQRSEDILGDYAVHDFYLYWFVRHGYTREKLLIAAKRAFKGRYTDAALDYALTLFLTRFAQSQYKRNAMPEGAAVSEVSLAQQDWVMPGDIANIL
jgi:NAD+ synthase (glutamine-hydrolysing)